MALDERRFPEAFAPGGANGERFVKRLPAHAEFRHGNVRVIVFEHFIADCRRKFQGIGARDVVSRAEQWGRSFRVKRPILPARLREGRGRGPDDVAVEEQLVDILSQLLAPELAAESKADATS